MVLPQHTAAAAAAAAAAKPLQSCPTLRDPIDSSPPGSAVPGILQARTLEWVCHYLFQCMKAKSESEVAQSCLTQCQQLPLNKSYIVLLYIISEISISSLVGNQKSGNTGYIVNMPKCWDIQAR